MNNKTVIIAENIKSIVAIIERIDNLLIPLTPCPLVQPLPILVPIPTNKPPMIIIGIELVTLKVIGFLEKNIKIKGPKIKPNTNKALITRLEDLVNKLLAMPLTPTKRPVEIKKMITANPIKSPPIKELIGVKFTKSILIIINVL